jgi:hypothetical protein
MNWAASGENMSETSNQPNQLQRITTSDVGQGHVRRPAMSDHGGEVSAVLN